jgi:hypothetical protein
VVFAPGAERHSFFQSARYAQNRYRYYLLFFPKNYLVNNIFRPLPEIDDLPAAYIIRQNSNTVPILALTAHALTLDRGKSLEAGMNDSITKFIDHTLV